jgi:hypothetical protein
MKMKAIAPAALALALLALILTALLAAPAPAEDTTPPTVTDVTADGVLLPDATLDFAPTEIVVTFSEDIDPATVSVDSFRLVGSGGDGTFGDGNEVEIAPVSVTLSPANVATMDLTGVVFVDDDYQVIIDELGRAVGYWAFDENAGGTAQDSSPYGNDGSLVNGPTWVPGRYGSALRFDGSSSYVDVPDAPQLNLTSAITIAVWINGNSYGATRRVLQKGYSDNQYKLTAESLLRIRLAGLLDGLVSASVPPLGEWHHVACTYDGVSLKLYVDAGEVGSGTASGTISVTGDSLCIGCKSPSDSAGDHFDGVIDEVRFYDRALTPAELERVMSNATLDVSDLAANPLDGEFTGSLPSGDGTPGGDFVCTFEITAPTVLITSPADEAGNVPVSVAINVTFSRTMDQTATEGAFLISGGVTGTPSWTGDTLTFTPDPPLDYSTYYSVTITTDAKDATGVPLAAARSFAFTTAAEPPAGDDDDGVCGAGSSGSPLAWLALLVFVALALSRSRRAARARA